MAQVTVTIDGKAYRMACEEGQEEHLIGLADDFDRYVTHLKSQFGEIGDLRLTVMAAIMIMDELSETRRRIGVLEKNLEDATRKQESLTSSTEQNEGMIASALSDLALQVHAMSKKLNGRPDPD